jgi:branched-chain amino acid transport system permease protein
MTSDAQQEVAVATSSQGKPRTAPAEAGPRYTLVKGSWQHRLIQLLTAAVIAVLLVHLSHAQLFRVGQYANVLIIAIAVVGLNVVTGYTGLLSIGHSAFFGLGAYTMGVLVAKEGWSPLATIPVAVVVCFVIGALVGVPSLRIKGLYLALVTLALGVAFPEVVTRAKSLTGGAAGMIVDSNALAPPAWTGLLRVQRSIWVYWLAVVGLIVVMLLSHLLNRSRFGLAMRAVRDHEIAAAANGVDVARTKILAFGVSGAITGFAGVLFGMYLGALSPTGSFTLLNSIQLVTGLVLGGVATQIGPIVGAVAVVFLPYYASNVTTGPLSGVLFGVVLIALVFLMPEGIVGRLQVLGRKVVRVVPADHPHLGRPRRQQEVPLTSPQ